MHSESQRSLFRSLRSQGWSLGRIATHLNIPKSTLYGWDYDDREVTAVLKAVRSEQIQEQYLPTFEEELKHFSGCLARIRKTLEHRSLAWVSTEYLLQLDLQLSSRLAKFRQPPPLHSVAEPNPVGVAGCLSRSVPPSESCSCSCSCTCSQPNPAGRASTPCAPSETHPAATSLEQGRASTPCAPSEPDSIVSPNQSAIPTPEDSSRTESYDGAGGTKIDPAVSTTCDDTFRTIVRFPEREPALNGNGHHEHNASASDNGIPPPS